MGYDIFLYVVWTYEAVPSQQHNLSICKPNRYIPTQVKSYLFHRPHKTQTNSNQTSLIPTSEVTVFEESEFLFSLAAVISVYSAANFSNFLLISSCSSLRAVSRRSASCSYIPPNKDKLAFHTLRPSCTHIDISCGWYNLYGKQSYPYQFSKTHSIHRLLFPLPLLLGLVPSLSGF